MAEEGEATELAGTREGGRGARKSNDILATPMRTAVTHFDKQQSKREQDAPKKLRSAMKRDLKNYFGPGKRSPIPMTAGNPITTVVQRRDKQGGPPTGEGGNTVGVVGDRDINPTRWLTPITKMGDKSIRSKSIEDGQNKNPRSDDKESGGEESTQKKSKEVGAQASFAVDLESMRASMKRKSPKAIAARHKKESAKKTPKKKATFALAKTAEAGEKKAEEEVAVCHKCIVGFAIRVDKGNNAKGGFDGKISEG
jgi:hypothetical protein